MEKALLRGVGLFFAWILLASPHANAQVLLAHGTLTSSAAGSYRDLSGLNYVLENGAPANLLGGFGSGMTYVPGSGNTFLAVPDRGPNAVSLPAIDPIDDTVSYINRFQTITMELQPNSGSGLPFTIAPRLVGTTLLHALLPLYYGNGHAFNLPSGVPPLNGFLRHYFTGRSDNADPNRSSEFPFNARFDPESIRVSNDGLTVFISDEYGPYVYQFLRLTGERIRVFNLPAELFVANPRTTTTTEMAANTSGRTPNKGMEGLAITPDGKTLVGIMQAALIQDATAEPNLLRMVTIDIASGRTTHEFAYLLTKGSGVSEITALNDHEFLVDERDGKGLADSPNEAAKTKQIFKIDLTGAVDVEGMDATHAAMYPVTKSASPILDVVKVLVASGLFTAQQIPAKIEGITFGPDVKYKGETLHTFWVANDNDFVQDYNGVINSNPNQFFVFGLTDAELGSQYVPQKRSLPFGW